MKNLLKKDPTERFGGSKHGVDRLKGHPFFSGFELYIMAEEECRRTSVTAAAAAVADAEFVAEGTASASRADGL